MRNTFLVFKRDYLGYVQAWGFWLSIASLPFLMALVFGFMMLAVSTTPVRYYAVIEAGTIYTDQIEAEFNKSPSLNDLQGTPEETQQRLEEIDPEAAGLSLDTYVRVEPPARDIDGLRPYLLGEKLLNGPDGERPLFAAIIVPADGSGIEYWSDDITVLGLRSRVERASREISREQVFAAANIDPSIIKQADDAAPKVLQRRIRTVTEQAASGDDVTVADRAPFYASLGLSYMLFFMVFSALQYLTMGTIEERSNKIFDTLLTSVRIPQLLAGKLGAVAGVTLTMMGAWGLFSGIGIIVGATLLPPEIMDPLREGIAAVITPSIIIPTIISFILGYLMYGMVFLALGSLCDTIQEAQTLLSPLMIILMMPMLIIAIAANDPTSPIISIVAWIPLFTPFILILRMPTDPPLWEVLAQIGLMALTAFIILWLAAKVYRAGAVHGAGISDAMSWVKGFLPGSKKKLEAAE